MTDDGCHTRLGQQGACRTSGSIKFNSEDLRSSLVFYPVIFPVYQSGLGHCYFVQLISSTSSKLISNTIMYRAPASWKNSWLRHASERVQRVVSFVNLTLVNQEGWNLRNLRSSGIVHTKLVGPTLCADTRFCHKFERIWWTHVRPTNPQICYKFALCADTLLHGICVALRGIAKE